MNEKGFIGFDGVPHDQRPLKRRRHIQEDGLKIDAFDNAPFLNEQEELDQELLAVESYTLSGFLIEQMWADLKSRKGTFSSEETERIPLGEKFWEHFVLHYMKLEEPVKDRFTQRAKSALAREEESWSEEERMIAWWLHIKTLQGTKKFERPSFKDLISIYTRLARVAEERFREQTGRDPNRTQYEHMLTDPSFPNMISQMMMNSRDALRPVMKWLEGEDSTPDLDDPTRRWSTKRFVIIDRENGPILQPNEELLGKVREIIQSTMALVIEQGKKHQILRCPVLSTGLFNEMCDWMYGEFKYHYLDQKY